MIQKLPLTCRFFENAYFGVENDNICCFYFNGGNGNNLVHRKILNKKISGRFWNRVGHLSKIFLYNCLAYKTQIYIASEGVQSQPRLICSISLILFSPRSLSNSIFGVLVDFAKRDLQDRQDCLLSSDLERNPAM